MDSALLSPQTVLISYFIKSYYCIDDNLANCILYRYLISDGCVSGSLFALRTFHIYSTFILWQSEYQLIIRIKNCSLAPNCTCFIHWNLISSHHKRTKVYKIYSWEDWSTGVKIEVLKITAMLGWERNCWISALVLSIRPYHIPSSVYEYFFSILYLELQT